MTYRANFLWESDENSVERLGYEFANSATEKYQRLMWKELLSQVRAEAINVALEAAALEVDKLANTVALVEQFGFARQARETAADVRALDAAAIAAKLERG
jgi:hypothetical protein